MKQIIIIVLFLCMYPYVILADEPVDPTNPTCEECISLTHKYPHFFCDGSENKKTICIEFPKTEQEILNLINGKRFLKFHGPICYNYDENSFPWEINSVSGNDLLQPWARIFGSGPNTSDPLQIIFDKRNLVDDDVNKNPFKRAFETWKNICERTDNPEGKENGCCVQIRFSERTIDFRPDDPNSSISANTTIAFARNGVTQEKFCNTECDRKIIINITNQFTKGIEQEGYIFPKWFFLTGELLPNGGQIGGLDYDANEMKYFDLYSVILHELGHLLGFNHLGTQYSGDENPCYNSGDFNGSVMYKEYPDNTRKELSWRDRCAYKRMYCCSNFNVSVQDVMNDGTVSNLYPNPTNRTLTIPYNFESSVEFVVFGVDGTVVQTGTIPEGSDGFTFDVSTLSNGAYTLVLNSAKPVFRKFIISK